MAEYKVVDATQLDNDLKGICDTIRSVPNTEYTDADLFSFPDGIKTAISKVCDDNYWSGHADGHREGASSGYGWGTYYAAEQSQNFGNKKDYTYWKASEDITNLKIPYQMSPTKCDYMFSSATTEDGSTIDLSQFEIDFSPCTSFNYWLNNSAISKIGVLSTIGCANLGSLLYNAKQLVTINHLILKEDGSQALGSAFGNSAIALENINQITGKFGKSFGFTNNSRLSHDTLVRMIDALATTSTTLTMTVGATNLSKLSATEKAVATQKGWTLT